MRHGKCSSIIAGPGNASVPVLAPTDAPAEQFEVASVNFTKASCMQAFKELRLQSSDWSDGLCVTASTYVCLSGSATAPNLVRINTEVAGASTMSASLYIDGEATARVAQQDWKESGLHSPSHAMDTMLLLTRGRCHLVEVVFDDGVAISQAPGADSGEVVSYNEKVRLTAS